MSFEISVLVSIGRHPVSGRERRAPTDARALELGLRLAATCDARLEVVHAGDPNSPALRDYLGMGVEALRVLAVRSPADAVSALVEWMRAARPGLVLTGTQAEAGWSSGCVPYSLAAALDAYALVPRAESLAVDESAIRIMQALPQGRRRALRASLPAIVTVGEAAPAPRPIAYARARRGRIVVEAPAGPCIAAPDYGMARPARARPARLRGVSGRTAVERLKALTDGPVHEARIVHPVSPEDAAEQIHAWLDERRLVQRAAAPVLSEKVDS